MKPVPGIEIEQQPEPIVLRMCLWAEARGEIALGKLAIAWVIHNRADKADSSLKAQILKPWQFSSFNANDPNRAKMLEAWAKDATAWGACDAIAELFEQKATIDPTLGSTHYLNRAVLEKQPDWSLEEHGWEKQVTIGSHEFGNAA